MKNVLLVALGGGVGSALRYLIGLWFVARFGAGFPWGTFFVNVTGSFVIGVAISFVASGLLSTEARLLVAIGLLGGYTTFSTYSYESLALLQAGRPLLAAFNVLGQVALGLAGVYLGTLAGRLLGGA